MEIINASKSNELSNIISNNDILIPQVISNSDLELAFLEYKNIPKNELIKRSAFFKKINGHITNHFKMCTLTNTNLGWSKNKLEYFKNNQFSIGYASHGLFPYKGKFHPQLIKGIINSLGLKKNSKLLDPMCGSGTTNIEASLMGFDSYAIDISPFCRFMTKTKYDILKIDSTEIKDVSKLADKFFYIFEKLNPIKFIDSIVGNRSIIQLTILAYLDAIGFSKRVPSLNLERAFKIVLKKYESKIKNYQKFPIKISNIGKMEILESSTASNIELEDSSIDAIITSPPYSDVIDYVSNDYPILKYFNININELRNKVIGLRGTDEHKRIINYLRDFDIVLAEYNRVLKLNHYLVLVIGFNHRQNEKFHLKNRIYGLFKKNNFEYIRTIPRKINGIKNVMRVEEIIYLKKII